jgi:hypothetical protein
VESEGVKEGVCRLLKDPAEGPYKSKHAEAGYAHYASIITLAYLGEAFDMALVVVGLVIVHVEGLHDALGMHYNCAEWAPPPVADAHAPDAPDPERDDEKK